VAAQPSKLRRAALRRTLSYVRRADYQAAQRVTHYVANSTAVQRRIAQYYQRASTVVHPFIDVERYRPRAWPPAEGGPGFLVVSELLPYKRVDLAVAACARLGQPLVVVGIGPELERLKRLAGPTVRFAGRVSEEELARLYAECWALLQCGEEDFGMSALEAQAAGRPVIAYGAGGALETIRDEVTGRLFHEQSVDMLTEALRGFDAAEFDPVVIRRHAEQFDEGRFRAGITRAVEDMLSQPKPRPAAVGASRAARAWPAGDETLPGAG
jgi:glycosyltransferase involved in cell wall biosynthesis